MANDPFENGRYQLSQLPSEPPDDLGLSPFERAAMRHRRTVLRGRDAPDEHTDPATLASIAASFFPLSGLADAFGYMPDFRGGTEPSLLENWRQGNYLTSAAQLAGVVVPPVGAIRKAARPMAGARRMAARGERYFDETIHRADGEVAQTELPRQSSKVAAPELEGLFATKGLEDKMLKRIQAGLEKSANWYNTEPLRQAFLRELGPDEGERAFRKYIHFVAATSAASDVGSNARNASYYFGLNTREGRLPDLDEKLPHPYGHFASDNHKKFAGKDFESELDQLTYQKMSSFFQNLIGNYGPVTIDRHALRLPAMLAEDANFLTPAYREMLESKKITMKQLVQIPSAWRTPTAKEYAALEEFYKRLAEKAGLAPGRAQAAAWVGGADLTHVRDNGLLSFMQHFEDRLDLTAKKHKISMDEALRRFIRGQVSLVSLDRQQNAIA